MTTINAMGYRAKIERLRGRLTNADFARAIGTQPARVGKVLGGSQNFYGEQIYKIAKLLGVSADYLLDDSIEAPPPPEVTPEERELLLVMRRLGIPPSRILDLLGNAVESSLPGPRDIPDPTVRLGLPKPKPRS